MVNKGQQGQAVIILLLVMVVALGIALSVSTRSTTEISTASSTEDSSRALAAAEAGIERALQLNNSIGSGASSTSSIVVSGTSGGGSPADLSNQSQANVSLTFNSPAAGKALVYPPIGRDSFNQTWLANPNSDPNSPPVKSYNQGSFYLYFGNTAYPNYASDLSNGTDNYPAVEVSITYFNNSDNSYRVAKYFIDTDSNRATKNGFTTCNPYNGVAGNSGSLTTFLCKITISSNGDWFTSTGNGASLMVINYPIVVRVRLLYSAIQEGHPIAIEPAAGGNLPPQADTYTSTGTVNNIQRKLRVFRIAKVMPGFFDYAVFSSANLSK